MSETPPPVKQKIVKDWRKDSHSIDKFQFIYYFLPHPDRRRRAELLSNKALLIYCLLIIGLVALFRLIPVVLPGVLGYASNITISDLLKYTNDKRSESGLNELVLNDKLSRAAEQKARDMFENDYWAHISPSGLEPWDFILAQNYDYVYAGENLAKNFSTSKEVVNAWYNSQSHKDNLLGKHYQEIGFAVVNGVLDGYETTLVVQMFGKPRSDVAVAPKESQEQEQQVLREITKEAVADEFADQPASEVPAEVPAGVPAEEEPTPIPERQPGEALRPVVVTGGEPEVLPIIDVATASRGLSMVFGTFLLSLLGLDLWYSRKRGIFKFTGHTIVHMLFLIVVLASIWFVLKPGAIL